MLPGQTYAIVASTFFSLCAYVQLNDPDPELWVSLYIVCGVGLSCAASQSSMAATVAPLIRTSAVGCLVYGIVLCKSVGAKMEQTYTWDTWFWEVLSHEEGREVGGIITLILHSSYLLVICNDGDQVSARRIENKKDKNCSRLRGTAALVAIALASFLWYFYQPLMNVRYPQHHCGPSDETVTVRNGL